MAKTTYDIDTLTMTIQEAFKPLEVVVESRPNRHISYVIFDSNRQAIFNPVDISIRDLEKDDNRLKKYLKSVREQLIVEQGKQLEGWTGADKL